MQKKSNRSFYAIALCLFLASVGWLAYSGVSENTVYFLNVSEAKAGPLENLKAARLFGTVAEENLIHDGTGLGVEFFLEDAEHPENRIRILYKGAVPDTFKAGAEVIIEGSIMPDERFNAKMLMTKCPSKYEKANRT